MAIVGAAYVMHGGCSNDAFSDFRATLISNGRKIYNTALSDPESLVDVDFGPRDDMFYEGFQYIMNEVAEARAIELPQTGVPFPDNPSGVEWDENSVNGLYPKLAAKYASRDSARPDSDTKKPWWKFW